MYDAGRQRWYRGHKEVQTMCYPEVRVEVCMVYPCILRNIPKADTLLYYPITLRCAYQRVHSESGDAEERSRVVRQLGRVATTLGESLPFCGIHGRRQPTIRERPPHGADETDFLGGNELTNLTVVNYGNFEKP